jgi:GR25 family glycosyltransferase involved in LPS biosynthesis
MKISLENINFFYINLDSRPDRKKNSIEQFSKHNLIVKREKACDSIVDNKLSFGESWTDGNKKCMLSHYNLMKNYKDEKILGIFEDDVVLCDDFIERVKYIENNFDKDWDIFYFSSFYSLNNTWHCSGDYEKTDIKYIHRVFGSFCTHALLINSKSIDKIIKLIEDVDNLVDTYAIDHLYLKKIQPILNCYAFTPGMATQLTNKSDIVDGFRDMTFFENVLGSHYYVNNLSEFDYDEYFKKSF